MELVAIYITWFYLVPWWSMLWLCRYILDSTSYDQKTRWSRR